MNAKKLLVTGVATMSLAMSAVAVPMLQLDIVGGTWSASADETILAPDNNVFTVRALYDRTINPSLANQFYLSAAIIPKISASETAFGSFEIDGTTYNAGSGMVHGNPPMGDPNSAGHDGKDLGPHEIFPTWFAEVPFSFTFTDTSAFRVPSYNTQDGSSGGSGNYLYYVDFEVDISNLILLPNASGYAVHFDLYHQSQKSSDWDVDKFAPFSHDAQSRTVKFDDNPPPVPDASTTVTLLGMAMIGLGALQRRFAK